MSECSSVIYRVGHPVVMRENGQREFSILYLSITNKIQRYTMILITINAPHISSGSSAHHQKLKTVYTASGICHAFTASYLFASASGKKQ
jgi:hypothetical protein